MLQLPSYDWFSLHAVGAPAFPFGVLRTRKGGENGLATVLLHHLRELLAAGHAPLLVAGHRESVLWNASGVSVPPLRGGALSQVDSYLLQVRMAPGGCRGEHEFSLQTFHSSSEWFILDSDVNDVSVSNFGVLILKTHRSKSSRWMP